MHTFDAAYWDEHWQDTRSPSSRPPPYVLEQTRDLPSGTALDAGCGTGAEAVELAATLAADLTGWMPGRHRDLVIGSYAHAAIGQLALCRRLAEWVGSRRHAPDRRARPVGPPGLAAPAMPPPAHWRIDTTQELMRDVDELMPLHDVVLRASRI